jgi:hypothetical protein
LGGGSVFTFTFVTSLVEVLDIPELPCSEWQDISNQNTVDQGVVIIADD